MRFIFAAVLGITLSSPVFAQNSLSDAPGIAAPRVGLVARTAPSRLDLAVDQAIGKLPDGKARDLGITASTIEFSMSDSHRYFGMTPDHGGSTALQTYTIGSTAKDVNFGLLGNVSLMGDLRHGLSLFAMGNNEELLGDFDHSSVTLQRSQWFGGAGLAYTF